MMTMSQVIRAELPNSKVVVLTGPNIAREVAAGKPTKAILASEDIFTVTRLARLLRNETLAFEITRDTEGVQLCAALKGIIAIAVGYADGLELGDNFTGVLMTYGLKEFVAIAEFLGISPNTIYGIAGLGDLITTCLSGNSRNRQLGRLLAKGEPLDNALQEVGMVVEGVQMAKTIVSIEDMNIAIPLFSAITKIIFDNNETSPKRFIENLMHYRS